jgi:Anti-sigma-K factor rskA
MTHDPYETQAAAYALGALDGAELVEFERHLAAGCPACATLLRDSSEALTGLALADHPRVPPPAVKEALLRRVAMEAPRRAPVSLRWLWLRSGLVAAAAMVVGGFLTWGFVAARYEGRLGQMVREATATRHRLEAEQAGLRERVAAYQNVVQLLRDPATRVVDLRGAGPSPAASGRLVWHEQAGGQLFVSNLPPAPEGKAYELWTITAGRPQAAGLFQVDASGQGSLSLARPQGPVDVFAVTLEPAAGVASPTGPIVLASSK